MTMRRQAWEAGLVSRTAESDGPPRWRPGIKGKLTRRKPAGFQPAMVRAHSPACTLSVTPGNSRFSSTITSGSPHCSLQGAGRNGSWHWPAGQPPHAGRVCAL